MRFFSDKQKRKLYELSNGHCGSCGEILDEGWHADHVIPYSKGGKTDIANGQALCQGCNIDKGDKANMNDADLYVYPNGIKPRRWQSDFLEHYFTKDQLDYLLEATPAAGKTLAALMVAYQLYNRGAIEQIIIVSNTDNLRTNQWLSEANVLDIDLTLMQISRLDFNRIVYNRDEFSGLSVTYGEVLSRTNQFCKLCQKHKTLVILDEVHHCGDAESKAWGPAILEAFGECTKRLLLSGTPFRTDDSPIPFVKYKDGQKEGYKYLEIDFSYGYGQALQDTPDEDGDGVVRPITFSLYNSEVGVRDLDGDHFHILSEVGKYDRSKALGVALDPKGDYVKGVLREADGRLNAIRISSSHKDAAGLVIARSTQDADKIAKILQKITGEIPIIVHSKLEEDTGRLIELFKTSRQKWIVSVKMISEGVDIPRLRVGVFLSPISTEIFFRQAVGRVVRWLKGVEFQMAYFYFPNIDPFTSYMKAMTEIVEHSYREKIDLWDYELGDTREPGQLPLFQPIYGDITGVSQVYGHEEYGEQLLQDAPAAFIKNNPAFGRDLLAVLGEAAISQISIRAGYIQMKNVDIEVRTEPKKESRVRTKHEQKADESKMADKAMRRYAGVFLNKDYFDTFPDAIKAVNSEWGMKEGYASGEQSMEYYTRKREWALKRIEEEGGVVK